ncbi:alpha-2-macroglobulin [Saccharicrinis sp. FJH2]|uniref:alpha-2-macroglobulin family protein n=1 Tax=Saccharicrinis sp. FJH65 TaxID=3344659 RepID=UPI0035F484EA
MKYTGIIFALILVLSVISCSKKKPVTNEKSAVFQQYVESYTKGTISRTAEITVRFTQDVPTARQGEEVKEDVIKLVPSVKGTAYWFDSRTIAFKPETWLDFNKEYTASVNVDKLFPDVDPNNKTVRFDFKTKKQDFSVRIGGLQSQGLAYRMEGTVLLADAEKNDVVENVISLSDKDLNSKLQWLHVSPEKHLFYVDSIPRKEDNTDFQVLVNGDPLNLDKEDKLDIEIPGLNNFKLLKTRVEQEPAQCLVVEFSDPLNQDQDISGLVRLEGVVNVKVKKENNVVRLYPAHRITGTKTLNVSGDLLNELNYHLKKDELITVSFEAIKPNVRFPQSGVIIPSGNEDCIVPFQAVNLSAVDLYIIKIFEENVPYFLQRNQLNGDDDLAHFGRLILKKKINLTEDIVVDEGSWNNYSLNLKELIQTEPGAIYRIEFRFRKEYSTYPCSSSTETATEEAAEVEAPEPVDQDYERFDKGQYWPYYSYDGEYRWRERDNPCDMSYYQNKWVYRNVIASNLGILVKTNGQQGYRAFVTNLIDASPLSGISVSFYNHQNQLMSKKETNSDGMAEFELDGMPWLALAQRGNEKTYLRVDDGTALSYSSFDVGGVIAAKGINAFIYGERGVWRPGDTIHLAMVIKDTDNPLPENQPATLYFYNPDNKLVKKVVNTQPVGKFYTFKLKTEDSDPTGNWLAAIHIGGAKFTKTIKIETIKPNRLKVKLNFEDDILDGTKANVGKLDVAWLHGAVGKNLKVKTDVMFRPQKMRFDKLPGFVFSDPAVELDMKEETVFEGQTDSQGKAEFTLKKISTRYAPSLLKAVFTTKAFEPGGEFSIVQTSKDYSPFKTYIGMKMPEKPKNSWHYNSGTEYHVEVASVDVHGNPVDVSKLDVEVYRLEWSWWWHSNNQNLAYYIQNTYHRPVISKSLYTKDGKGMFNLKLGEREWGRYLIRVIDPNGHSTGQIAYFDWPWRKSNEGAGGATRLAFNTDKAKYTKGETIKVQFPGEKGARALVSVETGTRILQNFWVEVGDNGGEFSLVASSDMAPNAYINIALIQPYEKTVNENPIRMYGVIPVFVTDPEKKLEPEITLPESVEPEQQFSVKIKEKSGKPMTYTLAIVDEGLLDITNFKTPDIHSAFYQRQALLVKMWDMFDYVSGAFGGKIEKVFGIGGGDELDNKDKKDDNRFKPVVMYSGPLQLKQGEEAVLKFRMPKYIGSVKAMVVAGSGDRYGSADEVMPVKKPVMVLATLPRVLSPGEKVSLPVSAFIMDETIKDAKVTVSVNDMFTIGETTKAIEVKETGEYNVKFDLAVADKVGIGTVKIVVETTKGKADYEINIKVRNPNLPLKQAKDLVLDQGKEQQVLLDLPGMPGTNSISLEFSSMPPLNLKGRLDYLIRYPYGCIEQTTSSVFPQLYINKLIQPDAQMADQMHHNIITGLNRLMQFQLPDGGFSYWPGHKTASNWGSVYATHFILEAEKQGYQIPYGMKDKALEYLGTKVVEWSRTYDYYYYDYTQSYRLYVLALAGKPDISGMNRLRQKTGLNDKVKWRLAAAYALIGKKDVAEDLVDMNKLAIADYEDMSETYGSKWRDYAMLLETLVQLGKKQESARIIKEFSEVLSSPNHWLSTQTTAWMLMSVAEAKSLVMAEDDPMNATYQVKGKSKETVKTEELIKLVEWDSDKDSVITIKNNSKNVLFVTARSVGLPIIDKREPVSENIDLKVRFTDMAGNTLNPESIVQGTDFKMIYTVRYTGWSRSSDIENVALRQIFPSGWEIINTRLYGEGYKLSSDQPDYMDIRDDRIYMFFNLRRQRQMTFEVLLNAAYEGRYYMPATVAEAMYSDKYYARTASKQVKVVR